MFFVIFTEVNQFVMYYNGSFETF